MRITPTFLGNFFIHKKIGEYQSRYRLSHLALVFSTALILAFPTSILAEGPYRVSLITSGNSTAYTTTASSIKAEINKTNAKIINIRTLTIEEAYSQKSDLPKKTDLFVPIGHRALKETLKFSRNIPIIASLISRNDFNNISRVDNNPGIGAIFIDQPLKRHLAFSRLVLPNITRYGFLISSKNKSAINQLSNLIDNDLHKIVILRPGDNVVSSVSRVASDAEVIIALPDPLIFNLRTTRNILLSTYRKRIPVIGFSKSYAKAGALAAIYSTPDLIGKQTGKQITLLANNSTSNNSPKNIPRLHSQYFEVKINSNVARSLGLPHIEPGEIKIKLLSLENNRHD